MAARGAESEEVVEAAAKEVVAMVEEMEVVATAAARVAGEVVAMVAVARAVARGTRSGTHLSRHLYTCPESRRTCCHRQRGFRTY